MSESLRKGSIPPALERFLAGRDTTPLSAEMLVKYQYIARMPSRATNFRFIVYRDGRLFYAGNSEEPNNPIYNTPLPNEPTRRLSAETLAEIEKQIDAEAFFQQPAYVVVPARDGAVAIVTARRGAVVHEVWYDNVDNGLISLLHSITPDEPVEQTPEDVLAYWQATLNELQQKAAAQQAEAQRAADSAKAEKKNVKK